MSERTKNLLRSKNIKLKKLRMGKIEDDLFGMAKEDNEAKIADVTAEIEALERGATEKEMKVLRPEVKCEDCDGDGEVEWTYEDKDGYTHTEYFSCPVCHGSGVSEPAKEVPTGRLVPPYDACIGIDKRRFIASHIQALCDAMELLNLDNVRYVVSGQRGDMFVLTDDIKVILCPATTNRVCPWIRPEK